MLLLLTVSGTAMADFAPYLRAQTQVAGPRVRMADLVRAERELDTALLALDLGPSPVVGSTRIVSREELAHWIAAAGLTVPAVWRGSNEVSVSRRATGLDHDDVIRHAKEALEAALGSDFPRHTVEPAGSPLPPQVPAGRVTLKARVIDREMALAARVVVWVEVWVEGKFYRALPVSFRVHATTQVLRARAEMPAGTSVSEKDFYADDVDVASVGPSFWPAQEPLSALRTKRVLQAGTVLMRGELSPMPQVERGNDVVLRVQAGNVVIKTTAKAMEDGWQDRVIKVMPLNATQAIQARVVGMGRVEAQQ